MTCGGRETPAGLTTSHFRTYDTSQRLICTERQPRCCDVQRALNPISIIYLLQLVSIDCCLKIKTNGHKGLSRHLVSSCIAYPRITNALKRSSLSQQFKPVPQFSNHTFMSPSVSERSITNPSNLKSFPKLV